MIKGQGGARAPRQQRCLPHAVAALGVCLALPAAAAPLTFEFEGIVTYFQDNDYLGPLVLDGSVAVGTPFRGAYDFDPEIEGTKEGDQGTLYRFPSPPSKLYVRIGNYLFQTTDDALDLVIRVTDNTWALPYYPPSDLYLVEARGVEVAGLPLPGSETIVAFYLTDPIPGALGSEQLPSAPPTLAEWSEHRLRVVSNLGFQWRHFDIEGVVTRIVPEPGTRGLLGLSLVLLVCARGLRSPRRGEALPAPPS